MMTFPSAVSETWAALSRLGVGDGNAFVLKPIGAGALATRSPITGEAIGSVDPTAPDEIEAALAKAEAAFRIWRSVPAPRRGELVRRFGEALRAAKPDLAQLVTLEAGKTVSEALGEVQEMIDICDFAVGLSRQLYGLTLATERPAHRLMETWHPLGPVAVITAFNFPVAVFAWNAALALVCGDPVIWKPSEKTPVTALGVAAVFAEACAGFGEAPQGLFSLVLGGREAGEALVNDPRIALVSATGSTRMGRSVGPAVAARFGRSLLELGGNNAAVIAPSANLDLAIRGCAFAAMGTAGQRCTTLRRAIVHETVYEGFIMRLKAAYASVRIGDPRQSDTLIGPLIDRAALEAMQAALGRAREEGALVYGGEVLPLGGPDAAYVRPALVEVRHQTALVKTETFAPILYVMPYRELEAAIRLQNAVPQGLSSSIFTRDLIEAETFLSPVGSDCGIANVNLGPSGAEIGGAFGGEKETGGGRESGSDAWRAYMRRATNTLNFGAELPLAQGVKFEI